MSHKEYMEMEQRGAELVNALISLPQKSSDITRFNESADSEKTLEENRLFGRFMSQEAKKIALGIHASVTEHFYETYGHNPSDALIAAAGSALENSLETIKQFYEANGQTEEADIKTLEVLAGLIEPIMYQSIAAQTTVPIFSAQRRAKYFRRERLAGTARAGVALNANISDGLMGAYAAMQGRYKMSVNPDGTARAAGTPDGVAATLTYALGHAMKKNIVIWLDHAIIAVSDPTGGNSLISKSATYPITASTVDYAAGTISMTFGAPLAVGKIPMLWLETNLEKAPTQVPKITYEYTESSLEPHSFAVAAVNTLMAQLAAMKGFGHNLKTFSVNDVVMVMVKSLDNQIILDQIYAAGRRTFTWDRTVPAGASYSPQEHYRSFIEKCNEADLALLNDTNGKAGLDFIYAGDDLIKFFMDLNALGVPSIWQPRGTMITERMRNQPHYLGLLNNRIKVYAIPGNSIVTPWDGVRALAANEGIFGGIGRDYFSAGFVTGAFQAPFPFTVLMNAQFQEQEMLYAEQYSEMVSALHYAKLTILAS